ncbi:MAG: aspartyl protease family protein [Parvularculaceae bacterium]|nr:aspartyl protease family protein [Parvularculaceae bacterium]
MKRIAQILACLVIIAAGAAQAAPGEPVTTVPYRQAYGGVLTVEVTIDGEGPYDFIIDTGATLSIAFQNLADQRGFSPTGAAPRRVLGILGSDMLDPHLIGDIRLGEAEMPDHVGVLIPDWAPPRETPHGILGLDFLKQYAVIFDVEEKTMTLYRHGEIPKAALKGWRKINLTANTYAAATGALFVTRGLINRSQTTFIVDLGSAATLINYEAAEAIYSSVVSRDLGEGFTTGSRLRDVFNDRTHARTALINRIQIGRVVWRSAGVWVYDAPIFDEIDVQRRPFGLLGADLIAAQDFALDFGENALYITKLRRR